MKYSIVLTHDIDVLSLTEIPWTCKTLWGFEYRCLKKSIDVREPLPFLERLRLSVLGLSTPFIKLGLVSDPWGKSLHHMLDIERKYGVRSTLFFIPFANNPGLKPDGHQAPSNRAGHYDLDQYQPMLRRLAEEGWEIGIHGIDSYWSPEAAKNDLERMRSLTGNHKFGVRMHWLYHSGLKTWEILSNVGYAYDASFGWNDKIGFPDNRRGPFHPFTDQPFLVLPLNIQDGALFDYAGLSEEEAWLQVENLIDQAPEGSTITILWHNHSFVPPYNWGSIYERIINKALSEGARVGRAIDVIE